MSTEVMNNIKYRRLSLVNAKKSASWIISISLGILLVTLCLLSLVMYYQEANYPPHFLDHKSKHGMINFAQQLYSSKDICVIRDEDKFDCYPQGVATEEDCKKRSCCWQTINSKQVPWCFYPKNYSLYTYVNNSNSGNTFTYTLKKIFNSPYPKNADSLKMIVELETENRLHIKIVENNRERYEPPIPKLLKNQSSFPIGTEKYKVNVDMTKSGFQVLRKNNDLIFDSESKGGFTFAEQFLQISAGFVGKMYGLGEHRSTFQLDTNWTKLTLFNHDLIPQEKKNLYGSHPFYVVLEPSGSSHGVLLLNSNAMDILLQPCPAVTFRTIGGVLDFYFFLGPTPEDVIKQYTQLIGYPFLPPYWSLGFHLCRFGYKTIDKVRQVWKRTRDAGIPFDTQWNDIDYMISQNDFTYDQNRFHGLPDFVQELHHNGMHWIPIIDPGISGSEIPGSYLPYDLGLNMDIFIKNEDNSTFIGKVWNSKTTVFPDFTNPKATEYWAHLLKQFHDVVALDGVWIDMNEPSNFWNGQKDGCPNNNLERPPYLPNVDGGLLAYKTICMSARQYIGSHYNAHNLYGLSEAIVTNKALSSVRGKRPFIISRSTFPGHGHYAGHWSGDVVSAWYDMKKSISQLMSFSLFGVPMMGADICGFNGNTTVALCNRWSQLGAFYPFSRNHNTDDGIDQDPVALGPLVAESARKALTIRYTLLPYLYTLFWNAHVSGSTVARPLFFEFPLDPRTHDMDEVFLWGSGILIIPVLYENATSVKTYLPPGVWYDWYTGEPIAGAVDIELPAPMDTIPVLIHGGVVIPTQSPDVTTELSRRNAFNIIAAYDKNFTGVGRLYWDDGDSIDSFEKGKYGLVNYRLSATNFTNELLHWDVEAPILNTVLILGFIYKPSIVEVNGRQNVFVYNSLLCTLSVEDLYIGLNETLTITWNL